MDSGFVASFLLIILLIAASGSCGYKGVTITDESGVKHTYKVSWESE